LVKPKLLHCDTWAGAAVETGFATIRRKPARPSPEKNLATQKELSDFLASVERRAFKQCVYAVHEEQAALDIVQDSMMKLAEKYSTRPAPELPLLFSRILQNTMRDHFRRTKVRSTWTTLLSNLGMGGDDDDADPLETLEVREQSNVPASPADQLEQSQVMAAIEEAVKSLPPRQREAFMLRYWEELDVSETAKAMGCSEGSVKTHCSRATHALAKVLRAKGITL
jgi:RNA polymerase sigma-70 factor (ECF subfamily)